MTYALLALSYLLGATPTSYWMGRAFHGLDLREHGSGNLGATNCVGWMFESRGVIIVSAGAADEESLTDLALEAGADDLQQAPVGRHQVRDQAQRPQQKARPDQ